jgi:transcriptional regulator with XRE-family HTH domain
MCFLACSMRKKYPGLDYIGRQVRLYRKAAALTQEELAEKVDLDNAYVSDLERGKCNISVFSLMRLAKALNVQVGDLFPDVHNLSI